MTAILGKFAPQAYALLRIVSGFLFLCHGLQKVFGMFGGIDGAGGTVPTGSIFWVAGVIEIIAGPLILIGLFAGVAAFITSGEMAVAYFMVHLPQGPWPLTNGGEPVVLFCFIFLFIATRGSGIWSVDALRGH